MGFKNGNPGCNNCCETTPPVGPDSVSFGVLLCGLARNGAVVTVSDTHGNTWTCTTHISGFSVGICTMTGLPLGDYTFTVTGVDRAATYSGSFTCVASPGSQSIGVVLSPIYGYVCSCLAYFPVPSGLHGSGLGATFNVTAGTGMAVSDHFSATFPFKSDSCCGNLRLGPITVDAYIECGVLHYQGGSAGVVCPVAGDSTYNTDVELLIRQPLPPPLNKTLAFGVSGAFGGVSCSDSWPVVITE